MSSKVCPEIFYRIDYSFFVLHLFNYIVNPVIYAVRMQEFRKETAALFFKYQRAIHKDPPEKCTEKRVIIKVSVIFCCFKRQRTLLFPVKEMKCFDFQVLLFLALNHCTVCAELCLMVWTSKPNILKSDVIFYEFWFW